MRQIQCVLIDPFACDIKHVTLEATDLAAHYAALSHESMPVDCICVANAGLLRGHDAIFVDDEGLLKKPTRFFLHAGYRSPLAGKGLVIGADHAGRSISAQTDLYEVERCTVFLELRGHRTLYLTKTPWTAPEAK
jgi:hypothetical protein